MSDFDKCSASLGRHNEPDNSGKCTWCGRKITRPKPKPDVRNFEKSDLTLYYEYFYDPNWGSE